MATITTLGFTIRSSFDPSGTRGATRSLLTVGAVAQATSTKFGATSASMQNMAAAALALAPALMPIATVASGVGAATVAMAVSSGSALGIYGAAMAGAIKRTQEMAAAGKALSPVQKSFIDSTNGMRAAWDKFVAGTQNQTLRAATTVVQGITAGIGRMKPVVDAVAPSIQRVADAFKNWMQGEGLQRFINDVIVRGVPALNSLIAAGRNVLAVLGIGFRTFAGEGVKVAAALERGSAALRTWAEGGGFSRWLAAVNQNAPQVRQFFEALWAALKNVSTAMGGLGPLSLGLATALLRIVAALPPSWIQAIVVGFVAFRAVMLSLAIISTVVTVVNALRTAFLALRGAWMILSLAFTTTPLGWLVLAIGAVVAGIVYLATQTRFFQTVWNAVWNGVRTAAQAVWNFLQTAWRATVNGIVTAWNAVGNALKVAWNAVWNALKTAGQAVWNAIRTAWNAVINTIRTITTSSMNAVRTAWTTAWNAIRTAGVAVWNALKTAWNATINAIRTVFNTFWSWIRASWNTCWNAVKNAANTIWNGIKNLWNGFITAIRNIFNVFWSWIRASWNTCWNAVKTAGQNIWNAIKNLWNNFITGVRNIFNVFWSWIRNAWNTCWNAVKNSANTIWNSIKDLWNKFINGVKDIAGKFTSWIKKHLSDAWNSVKSTASKLWHEIGEVIEKAINAVIGVVNGLIKGFNKITSFLKIDVKVGEIPKVNFNFAQGGMVPVYPYAVGGIAGMEHFARGGMAGAKNLKRGGTVSGYSPGRDTVPAMLSPGEGVLTPEAVRGLGGPGFVHSANRQFAGHRGAGRGAGKLNHYSNGYATGGMVQHFAVGGLVMSALARAGLSGVSITQGEYSNGSLSAGTHTGGGVIDIAAGPGDYAMVSKLRAAGFAAWLRTPAEGFAYHIHAVLMNHPDLSPQARSQVASYLAGGNGLANGGPDTGGGIDFFGIIKDNVGKILGNVYKGLSALAGIGGGIADFFGMGGDDDKDDGGGLFGTGIGPDVGPDIPGADKVGDAVKGVVGAATGMSGLGGLLPQLVLSFLDKGNIAEGLSDAKNKFGKLDKAGGGMFDIALGFGKKILESIMPDFLLKKKEEAGPVDFAGLGGGGGVSQWAGLAAQALMMAGLSSSQLPRFLALMQAESGGNPMAINTYDSNAMAGNASRGLMQVIPTTFAAYHVPGTSNNIFDPLANMAAAANYIKHVYGGQVPGSPYAMGTNNAQRGWHLVGENGPEMRYFRGGERVANARKTYGELSRSGGGDRVVFEKGAFQIDARGATVEAVREMEHNLLPKLRQAVQAGVGKKG
jgi:phage-related protein